MAKTRLDVEDYSLEDIMALARTALRNPRSVPEHVYTKMECDLFSSQNTKVKKLLEDPKIRESIRKHAKKVLETEMDMKQFFRVLNKMK
jgi:hypothetical protein